MSTRLALCLLLTCTSFAAGARDVRQADANGSGGTCADELPVTAEDPPPVGAGGKRNAPAGAKAAPARGGDNQSMRPPRWHSFLPGMFR